MIKRFCDLCEQPAYGDVPEIEHIVSIVKGFTIKVRLDISRHENGMRTGSPDLCKTCLANFIRTLQLDLQ